MIFIDRNRLPEPDLFQGSALAQRYKQAARFFSVPEEQRSQGRFDFRLREAGSELLLILRDLFHGKCGYCERAFEYRVATGFLDRFRPYRGAMGHDGTIDADCYWWLGFRWDNMLASCASCNRAKGSRFPIKGRRASPGTFGKELAQEEPLLVDPCADHPDEHLLFDVNGQVSGLTERGRVTIEVLALNRPELVRERAAEAKRFMGLWAFARTSRARADLLLDRQPFAALRRTLAKAAGTREESRAHETARLEQHNYDLERSHFKVAGGLEDLARERGRTRYIEHISLRRIGIHTRLELPIGTESGVNAPWMVILGDNGAGKSTILKAIAFALAGPQEWDRLGPAAMGLLPARGGVGRLSVRFTDGVQVKVEIDAEKQEMRTSFHQPRHRLIGFGATRLLPTVEHRPRIEPAHAQLANLFDPFCPLPDAVAWLVHLNDLAFHRASTAMKLLLDLPKSAVFTRNRKSVCLRDGRVEQDVLTLSDGYQTVIGMASAIMAGLVGHDQPVETAEGIVLIDELGNHLHPTWRMRMVAALKRTFPRVQFIATTHEPLCLRGLMDGEIAVLRRKGPGQVALLDKLPPIAGMLVDQILSSPHFGLGSTLDPETAKLLDEYYGLLGNPRRSDAQEERLKEIRPIVEERRPVGTSPTEQIMVRAIDKHLAEAKRDDKVIDPSALPKELQSELMGLMELAK